ncbi:MAG TPA: hypothetical protein VIL74_14225 [Pyrinomonadaceae bacterium]|jgi:hypothetical protein
MKNSKFKIQNFRLLIGILLWALCVSAAFAQSTNQSFPTAVASNEISGTIRARDVGDARLTTYFYTFNGQQGDIFINVVTKNLDGDIDVFTAEGLRPLTKIRVYSDNPEGETGRVIYLRQPLKLILRVEGRTPTDEPATFRIKFAGSFQAVAATPETEEPKQPEVASNQDSDVRVNSVGTIIEVKPKATPTPAVARAENEEPKRRSEKNETEKPETAKREEPEETSDQRRPEVVVTDNLPEKRNEPESKVEEKIAENEAPKTTRTPRRRTNPRRSRTETPVETETKPAPPSEKKTAKIAPVDPAELTNIRLIVDFKDGRKIERPINEILRFGVDKGILTIIAKDGNIGRYTMLDILKITVE